MITATSFIGGKNGDADGDSRNNGGGLDVIEVGEVLLEVGIAFRLNPLLFRLIAIGTVDFVHNFHPGNDLPKCRKAVAV